MNSESRRLLIARPRGFCAGVDRAIAIVEAMLEQVEGTLYVRREIVHNRSVVDYFSERGVVFVEELDEVPAGSSVIFSAHGVSPVVREDAERRGLRAVDATCPLVTKVHHLVTTRTEAGNHILLIGHRGHDEVTGTMGVAPESITLVSSVAEAENLEIPDGSRPYYVTQTTLSVDETREIVEALRGRFPDLDGPARSDICYATQNRQDAIKSLVADGIELLLVVGSPNSSNSLRLCEVARGMAVPAELIGSTADLKHEELASLTCLGLTAGASAPEYLVQEIITDLSSMGWSPQEIVVMEENVKFSLPQLDHPKQN